MRIPSGEKLRFLVAGGCNTLFGFADTMFFVWLLVRLYPVRQDLMSSVAIVLSTIVNITVSFFSYKLFVFRTSGNTLQEYLKSLLVYLPSMAISAIVAAPLTAAFRHLLPQPRFAPYVALGCIVSFTVVLSFLGHKHITFRRKSNPARND